MYQLYLDFLDNKHALNAVTKILLENCKNLKNIFFCLITWSICLNLYLGSNWRIFSLVDQKHISSSGEKLNRLLWSSELNCMIFFIYVFVYYHLWFLLLNKTIFCLKMFIKNKWMFFFFPDSFTAFTAATGCTDRSTTSCKKGSLKFFWRSDLNEKL